MVSATTRSLLKSKAYSLKARPSFYYPIVSRMNRIAVDQAFTIRSYQWYEPYRGAGGRDHSTRIGEPDNMRTMRTMRFENLPERGAYNQSHVSPVGIKS